MESQYTTITNVRWTAHKQTLTTVFKTWERKAFKSDTLWCPTRFHYLLNFVPSVAFTLSHPPSPFSMSYLLCSVPLPLPKWVAYWKCQTLSALAFCLGAHYNVQVTPSPQRGWRNHSSMILFSVRASWNREREIECSRDWHYADNSQKDSYLGWGSYTFTTFTFLHSCIW